ncbi:MAG TPA: hypothetical protein VGM23_03810 [Armatimonadota bacterium]|jgi:hypothetical protein
MVISNTDFGPALANTKIRIWQSIGPYGYWFGMKNARFYLQ